MPAAIPPNAPLPHETAATERIVRLIRDLRRQREAWEFGEIEEGDRVDRENPDVSNYNRDAASIGLGPVGGDLPAAIAAILAEERGRAEVEAIAARNAKLREHTLESFRRCREPKGG